MSHRHTISAPREGFPDRLIRSRGSSNRPLLLEFLATGLFLICLHLTKFNLRGLRLHCGETVVGA